MYNYLQKSIVGPYLQYNTRIMNYQTKTYIICQFLVLASKKIFNNSKTITFPWVALETTLTNHLSRSHSARVRCVCDLYQVQRSSLQRGVGPWMEDSCTEGESHAYLHCNKCQIQTGGPDDEASASPIVRPNKTTITGPSKDYYWSHFKGRSHLGSL